MGETDRMRAFERAGVVSATLIAAATIYALTGDAGLAVGIAVLALLIALVLLKLESLADRAFGVVLRLLILPFRLLRRILGG